MNAALIDALQAACEEVGVVFKDVPHDGQWHPADVEGDRQDSGAGRIKIFPDGEGGIVFNWKWGESRAFFATEAKPLSEKERVERDRKRQEAVRQAEAEAEVDRTRAAEKAQQDWAKYPPASEDQYYLRRKGIKPHGVRQKRQRSPGEIVDLVIPVKVGGAIQSLQFIGPDGEKRFLPGGKVAGGYFGIGNPAGAATLCIAEGFATGASVHEATGYPVAVAFNAGNLLAVAKAMREKFSDTTLILCADDDSQTEGNPGLTKATEAARAVGGRLAVPDFSAVQREGATDFNDMARLCGAEAVKAAVAGASAPADEADPARATQASPQDTIDKLAKLPRLEYELARKTAADSLGLRVGALDDVVNSARKRMGLDTADETDKQGKPIEFEEVEPWSSPVDGAQLLADLAAASARVLMLPPHAAEAIALWTVFTYVSDAASDAPLLVLTSPVKRCGKTTLIGVLAQLVHRPLPTNNITAPALFRVIASSTPCVLFDELDALLESDKTGEMRGILNAGHTRTTAHVIRTVGDDHEPRKFTVWCPKVLALIGTLDKQWSTVADRAVVIPLQRKPSRLKLPRLRRAGIDFGQLRSRVVRWAADHVGVLGASEPEIPDALNDRAADNWRPLLAIADAAGGAWPEKARAAALGLSGNDDTVTVDDGAAVRLLADIRSVFSGLDSDRIATDELIQKLTAIDDPEAPWADWNSRAGWMEKQIKPRQIAKLLKPYGIKPGTVRPPGGKTAKGYYLKDFEAAFASYLPPESPASAGN